MPPKEWTDSGSDNSDDDEVDPIRPPPAEVARKKPLDLDELPPGVSPVVRERGRKRQPNVAETALDGNTFPVNSTTATSVPASASKRSISSPELEEDDEYEFSSGDDEESSDEDEESGENEAEEKACQEMAFEDEEAAPVDATVPPVGSQFEYNFAMPELRKMWKNEPSDFRYDIGKAQLEALRECDELYNSRDVSEDLRKELGLLEIDPRNIKERIEGKLHQGFGLDAIGLKRDKNGKIVHVVLIQIKYKSRSAYHWRLQTMTDAVDRVKEALGMHVNPTTLLVYCPERAHFSAAATYRYTIKAPEKHNLHLVQLHGFEPVEGATEEERKQNWRKKMREKRDGDVNKKVQNILNMKISKDHLQAVRLAVLPEKKSIHPHQEYALRLIAAQLGFPVQQEEFYYIERIVDEFKAYGKAKRSGQNVGPKPLNPWDNKLTDTQKKEVAEKRRQIHEDWKNVDSEEKKRLKALQSGKKTNRAMTSWSPTGSGKSAICAMLLALTFTHSLAQLEKKWAEWAAAKEADKDGKNQAKYKTKRCMQEIVVVFAKELDPLQQLEYMSEPVLRWKFGENYYKRHVEYVGCRDRDGSPQPVDPDNYDVEGKLNAGKCVFFITEASGAVGEKVVDYALANNIRVSGINDEAHRRNNPETSPSASAMKKIVENKRKGGASNSVGMFATATPSKRLKKMCAQWKATPCLNLNIADCIELDILSDYEVLLMKPLFWNEDDEKWVPSNVWDLEKRATRRSTYAKANWVVTQILTRRKYRALIFAQSSKKARRIKKAMEAAFKARGVKNWVRVVVSDSTMSDVTPSARKDQAYDPFQDEEVELPITVKKKDKEGNEYDVDEKEPYPHVMIGVRLLNESIDLPRADIGVIWTTSNKRPPKDSEIIAFMQRVGRILRVNDLKKGVPLYKKLLLMCTDSGVGFETLMAELESKDPYLWGVESAESEGDDEAEAATAEAAADEPDEPAAAEPTPMDDEPAVAEAAVESTPMDGEPGAAEPTPMDDDDRPAAVAPHEEGAAQAPSQPVEEGQKGTAAPSRVSYATSNPSLAHHEPTQRELHLAALERATRWKANVGSHPRGSFQDREPKRRKTGKPPPPKPKTAKQLADEARSKKFGKQVAARIVDGGTQAGVTPDDPDTNAWDKPQTGSGSLEGENAKCAIFCDNFRRAGTNKVIVLAALQVHDKRWTMAGVDRVRTAWQGASGMKDFPERIAALCKIAVARAVPGTEATYSGDHEPKWPQRGPSGKPQPGDTLRLGSLWYDMKNGNKNFKAFAAAMMERGWSYEQVHALMDANRTEAARAKFPLPSAPAAPSAAPSQAVGPSTTPAPMDQDSDSES